MTCLQCTNLTCLFFRNKNVADYQTSMAISSKGQKRQQTFDIPGTTHNPDSDVYYHNHKECNQNDSLNS